MSAITANICTFSRPRTGNFLWRITLSKLLDSWAKYNGWSTWQSIFKSAFTFSGRRALKHNLVKTLFTNHFAKITHTVMFIEHPLVMVQQYSYCNNIFPPWQTKKPSLFEMTSLLMLCCLLHALGKIR
ncbi:MAG: hypothetical protein PWP71_1713 [Clostridia bacterium]|nr:hypothetical protein [Clostridia bacterium]